MAKIRRPAYTPPLRYWRWLWAWYALWPLLALLVLAGCVIYIPARGIARGLGWLADRVGTLQTAWVNADWQRAIEDGYVFPPASRAPAPELSDEWKARIREP